ncbi:hypothetical protein [Halomonas sp.]
MAESQGRTLSGACRELAEQLAEQQRRATAPSNSAEQQRRATAPSNVTP